MVQLLVRDQAVGSVQEKDAQHLVRQRSHRGHEILAELGAGRVDRLRCQVGLQTLKENVPGAEQDIRDRRVVTQNPLDRKSVEEGKSVSGRVDLGGRRSIKKKKTRKEEQEKKK